MEGPLPNREWEGVQDGPLEVPPIVAFEADTNEILNDINPLQESDFNGVDIYMEVVNRLANFRIL